MIDPRIALAVQVPDVSNALNMFQQALTSSQNREIAGQQESRAQALAPFKLQQEQQGVESNQQSLNQNRDAQRLTNLHQTGQRLKPFLDNNDIQGAQQFMLDNISTLQARIEGGENIDITESMETLAKLQANDVQGVLGDIDAVSNLVLGSRGKSVGQRDFETKVNLVKNDPELTTTAARAAAIDLRLEAGASTTLAERLAGDQSLSDSVAKSQADIAAAKARATEGEKLKQQRKHLPEIRAKVKLAEAAATERGEVLTDLSRMEATLPNLVTVTDQLKELALIATSTLGGRVFDVASKEFGFGATKGSTAKAKFIAIINNQVLPLLKPTFGGSFTVTEGDSLKATLGDPNATVEAKLATLSAFIEQKERDIRGKQAQLDQPAPVEAGINEFSGFKVVR